MLQEMTLEETIKALNKIALDQPAVNEVIESGDIYDLNSHRSANFGVFCCTQGQHTTDIENGQNTYRFFLYYVDRLKSDNSNKIEVQSTALEVLKNIVRTFVREYDAEISRFDFDVFTESFAQLCAGAYTTLDLVVDDDNCSTTF